MEFNPRASDIKFENLLDQEERIRYLYELIKHLFSETKELKDIMHIYDKEIFDKDNGIIPRIDKNLIEFKNLQTTYTRNILGQVRRSITNVLKSRDVIDDIDSCTSDIMKTLDNILEESEEKSSL